MNLRTLLLIDSLVLEAAGLATPLAGQGVLGAVLLVLAAAAFAGFLTRPRPEATA